jgi:hypothetical protein
MYQLGFIEFYSPVIFQIATSFTADCGFLVEFPTACPTAVTADVAMVLFNVVGISLKYI